MSDPIVTVARTDPNPLTVGEIIDWLQNQIDNGPITRDTRINGCEVALRINEEIGVIVSSYFLHVAAENRPLS